MNTDRHGFINWEWDTPEIEEFICAFDAPYAGASTFVDGERVRLKKCYSEFNDGPFHPLQAGLIYKVTEDAAFVASKSGTLVVREVLNEKGQHVLKRLKLGQRFFTPREYIEEAMLFSAEYSESGLVNG